MPAGRAVQARDAEGGGAAMRSTPQVECYSSAVKVPPQRNLLVQVDQTNECLLLPLMGVHTPFHINTVKSINYSQARGPAPSRLCRKQQCCFKLCCHAPYIMDRDLLRGELEYLQAPVVRSCSALTTAATRAGWRGVGQGARKRAHPVQQPALVRRAPGVPHRRLHQGALLPLLQARRRAQVRPGALRHPCLPDEAHMCTRCCSHACELDSAVSVRRSRAASNAGRALLDAGRTARGSVQEAQALRRAVQAKDKQDAERATLVKQEKLQRFSNKAPLRLHDIWVYPPMAARKKVSGQLEAHYNGFRCAAEAAFERAAVGNSTAQ
jgi:FACT complex subunit (SPT16/CDC68)